MPDKTCITCKKPDGSTDSCCFGQYAAGANWKCGVSKLGKAGDPALLGYADKDATTDEICENLGSAIAGQGGWKGASLLNPFAASSAKKKKR